MMIFEGQEWIHYDDYKISGRDPHYSCHLEDAYLVAYDDGRWYVDFYNTHSDLIGSEKDLTSAMKRAIKIYNALTETLK